MKLTGSKRAQGSNQTLNRIFVISVFLIFVGGLIASFDNPVYADNSLKHFTSKQDIKQFIENNRLSYSSNYGILDGIVKGTMVTMTSTAASTMPGIQTQTLSQASAAGQKSAPAGSGASDYSTTNVQVQGVDEGDFLKNDGKYIYMIKDNQLVIVNAYPAENADIVSKTIIDGTPTEIYINGDRLVVIGTRYKSSEKVYDAKTGTYQYYNGGYGGSTMTFIDVYDVSDRKDPKRVDNAEIQGNYVNSRMIGDYVYPIAQEYVQYPDVQLPKVVQNNETQEIPATDIQYVDTQDYSYAYTHVAALNIKNDNAALKDQVYLLGTSITIYASEKNLYLTHQIRGEVLEKGFNENGFATTEKTAVHKISLNRDQVEYKGSGEVPGHILNQFSMDEYNGYFRIATTVGQVARTQDQNSATNNVYILDENLQVVGKLENLAPKEKIYSARFMGDKGYLVTFKKVDPLFVIDLKSPTNPKVLGELKIDGYSDYLEPYDETHLIGIGKDAIQANEGDFAWYQGVKVALFDVSDFENPKQVGSIVIGDRGTDSEALRDHKAVLFSKSKNLLVLPINLYEINPAQYENIENNAGSNSGASPRDITADNGANGLNKYGLPANTYGQFVWQGVYALKISPQNGISIEGRISHADSVKQANNYYYGYGGSSTTIRRSLYMDDTLYTVSNAKIKMNSLEDFKDVNEVNLSAQAGSK